jgi:hypothetical protein
VEVLQFHGTVLPSKVLEKSSAAMAGDANIPQSKMRITLVLILLLLKTMLRALLSQSETPFSFSGRNCYALRSG